MIRDEEHTRDKLKFYTDRGQDVHLKLVNGYFYNGFVVEFQDDKIIFNDDKLGEIILFLSDIRDVVKREGEFK